MFHQGVCERERERGMCCSAEGGAAHAVLSSPEEARHRRLFSEQRHSAVETKLTEYQVLPAVPASGSIDETLRRRNW